MLNLYCRKLMRKVKEHEGKKYLMADEYVLDKVLDNIKEIIGIEKFDDTKILMNTEDKLTNDITFKNVVILVTCVIKGDDKFHLQLF